MWALQEDSWTRRWALPHHAAEPYEAVGVAKSSQLSGELNLKEDEDNTCYRKEGSPHTSLQLVRNVGSGLHGLL